MEQAFHTFQNHQYRQKFAVEQLQDVHIYDLDYYGKGLNSIETLHEGEIIIGTLTMKRQYVKSHGLCDNMFSYHTNIRDNTIDDDDFKATMAIVHGYGENSDIFLESALQYALNGFDVHLIDLRGFGMTGGVRMNMWKISDLHHDVVALLQQVNPKLPLLIYGHSMGGLTILTFLVNNPTLNVSGVILSAPFLGVHESAKLDDKKKLTVKLLAPELEEFVVNPRIPVHLVCRDKIVFREFLQNRKFIPFMSLGQIDSIIDFHSDLPVNIQDYKYPTLTMLAEKEFLVNNKDARRILSQAGSQQNVIVEYKDCFHELQKEPNKDEIHAKVLQFAMNLLKDKSKLKPFGVFNEKALRFGRLKKRGPDLVAALKRKIFAIIIYLVIGFVLSKGYLKGKTLATLIWPIYIVLKKWMGMK
ncbi:alpha beta fold family protein [Stylonychia lemnae]|uniref:Alpha beta fold family protein n=1 Tax=Stylonychia lemnae TaxID=5949 RepID=A0A078AH90_STYLE|nr:alpha beta fold family protein [Stylonychia lemnae]|eukprot:CDW81614.1 alpha beta fold family protein [Stylonychia lemnae]